MVTPLLTTKLHIPPVRPELVLRPRLIERLNAGLISRRKLTLISAPAGYGKTTLVNVWLRSTGRPFAWISLDEGDNDLIRFLIYLVAAFRQVDDGIGQAVQHLLEVPQLPPVEPLLTELINDISTQSSSFVLVLDDYHTITELGVHEAVRFLLERQPPQMHLVIVSRQDPPFPLSRLRGRGQVTEIRQNDLCFTLEEATTFLNRSMGLNLKTSEIIALDAHTEGWIVGLQMAAFALQSRIADGGTDSVPQFIDSFSGRHHFILDYLTDEVLKHQPESVQIFLLQTAILDRLTGPLCDAVTGISESANQRIVDSPTRSLADSQAVLEYLESSNLFIVPLDDERRWYRYHRLFAELLRARLQEVEPDQVPRLHLRAAQWYDQNALLAEAVHHALAIPDSDLAAGMIERAIPKVATWSGVNVAMFSGWLKVLSDDVVRARPRLRLFASRVLYLTGQRERTERILQELEESLHDDSLIPDAENMLGLVVADRASYAAVRGDVRQAIEFAHQALTYLSEDNTMMRMRVSSVLGLAHFRAGNMPEAGRAFSQAIAAARAANLGFVAVPLVCNLAEVQIAQGQLRQAFQTCQQAMEMAIVDGARTSVAGFAGLELSKILYEQNDLPAAERYASESLDLLIQSGTTDSFGIGHALLARIRQALGDDARARAAIQRAVQITQGFDIARVATLIAAYQARIWLAQGKRELAARWAREYGQLGETEYLREFEDLTLVRVLLAQDKPRQALILLDTLLPSAEAAGRMGTVIEISALRALALRALGDPSTSPSASSGEPSGQVSSKALGALERALQLAEPEGYARVFIDEGEPMAELLRYTAVRTIAPEYVRRLLQAFGIREYGSMGVWECRSMGEERPSPHTPTLIEPLTDREMQVLQLLADGLSNPEIAQRLFISLPTVKSHTRNIYGKIGVHNRKEAVVRARALGILSS